MEQHSLVYEYEVMTTSPLLLRLSINKFLRWCLPTNDTGENFLWNFPECEFFQQRQ